MAFMNGNGFNNQNNNNGNGEKQKTNFRIGKLYGEDGIMDVTMWASQTGIFTILTIKQAVGKDPSTGNNVYEQKMPNELPRLFMNTTKLDVLMRVMMENKPATANFTMDGKSKVTVAGDGSKVKFTITDGNKGERSITFKSTNIGSTQVFPEWNILCEYLKICYKKALCNKLDPEEFSMVMGGAEDNSDDNPFENNMR